MSTEMPGWERQWTGETFLGHVVLRKTECLIKMCIFAKDVDVNNSSFIQAIPRRIDVL